MIHSVHIGDDAGLISQILQLHASGPRVLDATYGHGGFWRNGRRDERWFVTGLDLRMADGVLDLARRPGDLVAGSFEALPFRANTFDAIMCDPPFLTRGGDRSQMKARYTAYDSYDALMRSLERAMEEFYRLLKPKGIVVLKAMDWTEGRRRRWIHLDVVNLAISRFRLDDLFVKVAVQNMRNTVWRHQDRSRAAHVYFMVFRPLGKSRRREQGNDGHGAGAREGRGREGQLALMARDGPGPAG